MIFNIENSFGVIYNNFATTTEILWPKIIWAIIILLTWWIIARLVYLFLMFVFRKTKLNQFIDRLKVNFDEEKLSEEKKEKPRFIKSRFTDKIKVDDVVAKAMSYYLLIVFFRLSIWYLWIIEVESFLRDVTNYLPNLFVWVLIWFFGIRFANFVYDVVYHTLTLTKEKTAKIIAEWARIIILFFTLMVFLEYTKIVSMFIINTVLIGFISMIALAWGIAFWLWWREIAKEILETFKKD